MKTQEEIEYQIQRIKAHIERVPDSSPELIWCRARIQALRWALKR